MTASVERKRRVSLMIPHSSSIDLWTLNVERERIFESPMNIQTDLYYVADGRVAVTHSCGGALTVYYLQNVTVYLCAVMLMTARERV